MKHPVNLTIVINLLTDLLENQSFRVWFPDDYDRVAYLVHRVPKHGPNIKEALQRIYYGNH